jgi:phage-related protein
MKQESPALRKHGSIAIVGYAARLKPVRWIGASHDDLDRFPTRVKRRIGYSLYQAQIGNQHSATKILKGFGGADVLEVSSDFDGNAFRAVYTVRFPGVIYVLHAFQKKSHLGIQTPRRHLALVRERLKQAERRHAQQSS